MGQIIGKNNYQMRINLLKGKQLPKKAVTKDVKEDKSLPSNNDTVTISSTDSKEESHKSHHGGKGHDSMHGLHKGTEINHGVHAGHHASDVSHGANTVHHGSSTVHHAASNAKHLEGANSVSAGSDIAGEAGNHAADIATTGDAATAGHHAADVATAGDGAAAGHHAADIATAGDGASAGHHAAEVAEAADSTEVLGSMMTGVAGIGSGLVSGYFAVRGAKNLKKAIKEKNKLEGAEAAGEIALAGQSGINFAGFVSKGFGGAAQTAINSPLVQGIASGLGVVHGGIDAAIGGKQIYDGIKNKDKGKIMMGSFDVGIGAAIIGISLGGGPIAAAGLGAVFLTKMGVKHRKSIKKGIAKAVSYVTPKGRKERAERAAKTSTAVKSGKAPQTKVSSEPKVKITTAGDLNKNVKSDNAAGSAPLGNAMYNDWMIGGGI